MSREVDWDDPDDVVDFEDMNSPKKEYSPPPSPPKKEEAKEEPVMSERQEKIISNATKQAQKLSNSLEQLDFNLERFSKFEKKVSSFKIKNTIVIGAVALFLGGYIGSLAQSELNNYYVNQEAKSRLGAAVAELDLLQKAKEAGVIFAIDEERVVIWSTVKNEAVVVVQTDKNKIFEINLKKVKKIN